MQVQKIAPGMPCRAKPRSHTLIFSGLVLLLSAAPSSAMFTDITTRNFMLLPEYCQVKLSENRRNNGSLWNFPKDQRKIRKWKEFIGHDWEHLHHYCVGRVLMMIAESEGELQRTKLTRQKAYSLAAAEINYTRNNALPGARSPIAKEMLIYQSRAYAGAGNVKLALSQLEQYRKSFPNDVDTYVAMGTILGHEHRYDDAIAILEQGLPQVKKQGPILFWLARFYFEIGNHQRAMELTEQAEAAGMKMDSLRQRMGSLVPSDASR